MTRSCSCSYHIDWRYVDRHGYSDWNSWETPVFGLSVIKGVRWSLFGLTNVFHRLNPVRRSPPDDECRNLHGNSSDSMHCSSEDSRGQRDSPRPSPLHRRDFHCRVEKEQQLKDRHRFTSITASFANENLKQSFEAIFKRHDLLNVRIWACQDLQQKDCLKSPSKHSYASFAQRNSRTHIVANHFTFILQKID